MKLKIDSPEASNNTTNKSTLFEQKQYYNYLIKNINIVNKDVFFSNLYLSKALYGVLDHEMDVVLPKQEYMEKIDSNNKKNHYMIDFAADSFLSMKEYLLTATVLSKLSNNSPFSNIKVYRSYQEPQITIDSAIYLEAFKFKEAYTSDIQLNSKIKDHTTFNKELILFLKDKISENVCITKSGIITSNHFEFNTSGLTIDILDKEKCDDDKYKFENFLNRNDFINFKDVCKRFGFYIDMNIPWRLTLDLNSPAMANVFNNEGPLYKRQITNAPDVFVKRYNKVYASEVEHIKDYFYKCYSYFMEKNIYYEEDYNKIDGNRVRNRRLLKREVLNREQYLSKFDDRYWLRAYAYFRNIETLKGATQQKFDNLVREAGNFLSIGQHVQAQKYINDFFKTLNSVDYYYTSYKNAGNVSNASTVKLPYIIF